MLSEEAVLVLKIAQVTHEANRAWCEANGDYSQVWWSMAPGWQHLSAINGVEFHMANPGTSASASHENWMAEKLATGWKYGTTKDSEAKLHPCLVPFEDLPKVQQAKDRLFCSIVHALAAWTQ
jgi:RyR domain